MPEIKSSRFVIILVAAFLTLASILITIFALKNGIVDVYPYLYIIPVILIAYASPRVGIYFTILMGWLYLGLVFLYGAFDLHLLASSCIWFYIFVTLGILISTYTNEIAKQQKFQEIFMSSQSGIFTFDLGSLRIQQHNARLDNLLGYSDKELDNREISAIWESPEEMNTIISRIRSGSAVNDAETTFVKKDGTRVWCQITMSCSIENLVTCSVADISERKEAVDQLRETEIQYQMLFDRAGDAIIIHDTNGLILAANRIACQRSGYSAEELKTMHFTDLDLSACAAKTRASLLELGHKGIHIYETIHRYRSGKEIPTEISSSLIEFRGRPAVISIIRDISERKRAEALIREREQRFRKTGELIPYGVWSADTAGQFTYCSESFLALLDMTLEECANFGLDEAALSRRG